MSLLLVIAALLVPATPKADATPTPTHDTAGIYRTKDDFINERISSLSLYEVKIKHVPFWSGLPLNIDSADRVYLRQADGREAAIRPDVAFGFTNRSIKYLYIPGQQKYLAVLNEKAPVFLFIKEKYIHSFKWDFVNDSLLYTRDLNAPLKELTASNIKRDFSDNKELANRLYLLRAAIVKKGFDAEVHRRAFLRYRQLVRHYLDLSGD